MIADFPLRPEQWIFLRLLLLLPLNLNSAAVRTCRYRTQPELGVEMLRILPAACDSTYFHAFAKSAYYGHDVLAELPNNCALTSRLLLVTRLYDAVPKRRPRRNGTPRKPGQ